MEAEQSNVAPMLEATPTPTPEPKKDNKAVFIIIAVIVALAIIGFAIVLVLLGQNNGAEANKAADNSSSKESTEKTEDKKPDDKEPDKKDPEKDDPEKKDPDGGEPEKQDSTKKISSGKCEIPYFGWSMGDYEDGKMVNCTVQRGVILNWNEKDGYDMYVLVPREDGLFYAPTSVEGVGSIVKKDNYYLLTIDDPESWRISDYGPKTLNSTYRFSFDKGVVSMGFGFYGQAIADTRIFFVLSDGSLWSASIRNIVIDEPDMIQHKNMSNVAAILTGMVYYFTDNGMTLGASMPYAVRNDGKFYLLYN